MLFFFNPQKQSRGETDLKAHFPCFFKQAPWQRSVSGCEAAPAGDCPGHGLHSRRPAPGGGSPAAPRLPSGSRGSEGEPRFLLLGGSSGIASGHCGWEGPRGCGPEADPGLRRGDTERKSERGEYGGRNCAVLKDRRIQGCVCACAPTHVCIKCSLILFLSPKLVA